MFDTSRKAAVVSLVAALVVLGSAAAAYAGPIHYYAELLTSSAVLGLPGDARTQVDVSFDPTTTDIVLDGSVTAGDGLGSGYVGSGGSITYTHRFAPSAPVESILGAVLAVATVDDALFDGAETVQISLDGTFFASGSATFQVFGGSVSAALFQQDGEAVVSVSSTRGDVNIVASLFKVAYSAVSATSGGGTGAVAVPEPHAVMLFSAGAGMVGIGTRRRR